jgi:hypothetical protein
MYLAGSTTDGSMYQGRRYRRVPTYLVNLLVGAARLAPPHFVQHINQLLENIQGRREGALILLQYLEACR